MIMVMIKNIIVKNVVSLSLLLYTLLIHFIKHLFETQIETIMCM